MVKLTFKSIKSAYKHCVLADNGTFYFRFSINLKTLGYQQIPNISNEDKYLILQMDVIFPENSLVYYNPWGFIINSIQYKEFLEDFEWEVNKKLQEIVGCQNEKKFLIEDMEQWQNDSKTNFALPIENVDLMYNVMKRLAKFEDKVMEIKEYGEIVKIIRDLFNRCLKQLKKQDNFYKENKIYVTEQSDSEEKNSSNELADIFERNPVVDAFLNDDDQFETIYKIIYYEVEINATMHSKGILPYIEEELD